MSKTQKSSTELKKLLMSLERIEWALEDIDHKAIKQAREFVSNSIEITDQHRKVFSNNEKTSHNLEFLTGILPSLFKDRKLFPKNEDIISFTQDLIGLERVSRVDKRSRYEIIGLVVCEATVSDSAKLERLISAINVILNDETIRKSFEMMRKEESFSWNEAISRLFDL